MNCKDYQTDEWTERHLLGLLTPEELQEFEAHWSKCAQCRHHLRLQQVILAGIDQAGREGMKQDIREAALAYRAEKGHRYMPAFLKAAAAILMLVAGPGLIYIYTSKPEFARVAVPVLQSPPKDLGTPHPTAAEAPVADKPIADETQLYRKSDSTPVSLPKQEAVRLSTAPGVKDDVAKKGVQSTRREASGPDDSLDRQRASRPGQRRTVQEDAVPIHATGSKILPTDEKNAPSVNQEQGVAGREVTSQEWAGLLVRDSNEADRSESSLMEETAPSGIQALRALAPLVSTGVQQRVDSLTNVGRSSPASSDSSAAAKSTDALSSSHKQWYFEFEKRHVFVTLENAGSDTLPSQAVLPDSFRVVVTRRAPTVLVMRWQSKGAFEKLKATDVKMNSVRDNFLWFRVGERRYSIDLKQDTTAAMAE